MKKKTWVDAHEGEIFTDNTKEEKNRYCKDCLFRSDGTVWSNDYRKAHCQIYKYPVNKPNHVDNNKLCEYYHNENDIEDDGDE